MHNCLSDKAFKCYNVCCLLQKENIYDEDKSLSASLLHQAYEKILNSYLQRESVQYAYTDNVSELCSLCIDSGLELSEDVVSNGDIITKWKDDNCVIDASIFKTCLEAFPWLYYTITDFIKIT